MGGKLDALFRPKSVAIVGASRTPGKVGHILTRNMINSGYTGDIIPINPNAEEILGLKAYPSVLDVTTEIDLAVISIPAPLVLKVAEECGRKGVKALVVITAGFKETGHEGAMLESQLVEVGEKYGMRIQGPNCLGIINTSIPLNLSFAAAMPKKGKIGFISQSGALGTAVLDWVIQEDIGFHSFVSLGNKADLDEVDFIEAMGEDEDVGVILLYLESIEKGAYKTAFEKTGVIMAESVEELFNYAIAFTEQPLPKGEGLAIVTNAGGPGILATDLSEKLGLRLTNLQSDVRNKLMEKLPPAASTGNPIDVLGGRGGGPQGRSRERRRGDPDPAGDDREPRDRRGHRRDTEEDRGQADHRRLHGRGERPESRQLPQGQRHSMLRLPREGDKDPLSHVRVRPVHEGARAPPC